MARADLNLPWFGFACDYADMKWPKVAATTRRTHAEALTAVTMLMFRSDDGRPGDTVLRAQTPVNLASEP